jgi:hypothetical protein
MRAFIIWYSTLRSRPDSTVDLYQHTTVTGSHQSNVPVYQAHCLQDLVKNCLRQVFLNPITSCNAYRLTFPSTDLLVTSVCCAINLQENVHLKELDVNKRSEISLQCLCFVFLVFDCNKNSSDLIIMLYHYISLYPTL